MALSKFDELLAKELEVESPSTQSFAVYPGFIRTGIGSRPNEINGTAMQHPAMQKLFSIVSSMDMNAMKTQTPELCANTMVALATDPKYAVLTGHHIHAPQELPKILEEAQKDGKGRIGTECLHVVKIAIL